jgi:hypothetical protein
MYAYKVDPLVHDVAGAVGFFGSLAQARAPHLDANVE